MRKINVFTTKIERLYNYKKQVLLMYEICKRGGHIAWTIGFAKDISNFSRGRNRGYMNLKKKKSMDLKYHMVTWF